MLQIPACCCWTTGLMGGELFTGVLLPSGSIMPALTLLTSHAGETSGDNPFSQQASLLGFSNLLCEQGSHPATDIMVGCIKRALKRRWYMMPMQSAVLAAPSRDTCLLLHNRRFPWANHAKHGGLVINCCLCKAASAAKDHTAF